MVASLPTLDLVSELLAEHCPKPRPPVSRDPFELVLWEQVAYLAKDEVRQRAFNELRERVGLTPQRIATAPLKTLRTITRMGGSIAAEQRAERMKKSAEFASDLTGLGKLSLTEARKRLEKFPMIGTPAADKILLFAGLFPVFALESNGLRVLLRIGFGTEGTDYARSYRSVMEAIATHLPDGPDERIALHERLRQHGLLLCKRSRPLCEQCSLRPHCRHGLRAAATS